MAQSAVLVAFMTWYEHSTGHNQPSFNILSSQITRSTLPMYLDPLKTESTTSKWSLESSTKWFSVVIYLVRCWLATRRDKFEGGMKAMTISVDTSTLLMLNLFREEMCWSLNFLELILKRWPRRYLEGICIGTCIATYVDVFAFTVLSLASFYFYYILPKGWPP